MLKASVDYLLKVRDTVEGKYKYLNNFDVYLFLFIYHM